MPQIMFDHLASALAISAINRHSTIDQPTKPDKGRFRGSCNRRACQLEGATWYNKATGFYYCRDCARKINSASDASAGGYLCYEHTTEGNPYVPWTGNYAKQHYDVKLPSGEIIKHCWPNAGIMNATDGSGRQFKPEDGVLYRISPTHPCDKGYSCDEMPLGYVPGEPATAENTVDSHGIPAPKKALVVETSSDSASDDTTKTAPLSRQQRRHLERQAAKKKG